MDYKALIEISENRAAMFHTRRDEGGYIHEENCQRALWELLARAEAAEKIIEEYTESARAISLWLSAFCDRTLSYPSMISNAARKVSIKYADMENRAEAAEAELEQKEKYYSQMADALAATDSMELTEAKRKLAVAVSDLETVMAYGTGNLNTCIFCKNAQCYARGGTKPCLPKWRGTEEE